MENELNPIGLTTPEAFLFQPMRPNVSSQYAHRAEISFGIMPNKCFNMYTNTLPDMSDVRRSLAKASIHPNAQESTCHLTDADIRFISYNIGDRLLALAKKLQFSVAEQFEIEQTALLLSKPQVASKTINKWRMKRGNGATRGAMIRALRQIGATDISDKLTMESKTGSSNFVRPFKTHVTIEFPLYPFRRGFCVIINNNPKNVKSDAEKETTNDATAFKETFQNFDFDEVEHENKSTEEMNAIFEGLRKKDFAAYDCFVCCILSQGNADLIFGTDDTDGLRVDQIVGTFDNHDSLKGKPKLFFIQIYTTITTHQDSTKDPTLGKSMPIIPDYLLYTGTIGLPIGHQEHDRATFIKILTEILQDKGDEWDIMQVCSSVNSVVADQESEDRAMPMMSSTLKRLLKFKRRSLK